MRLNQRQATELCWFFDYDGTLCPHQEVWEERVYNPREIVSVLEHLDRKGSRVYWNTGRRPESLASVDAELMRWPGYYIQGSLFVGANSLARQRLGLALPAPLLVDAQQSLKAFPELKLEIKETSLRVAVQKQRARGDLEKWAKRFSRSLSSPWVLILGHRGAELVQSSCNKGTALIHAMGQVEQQGRIPVALGDDVMDRTAMQAALDLGGYAVGVGDSCGWVTELKHQPDQLLFFETPQRLHEALLGWSWRQES